MIFKETTRRKILETIEYYDQLKKVCEEHSHMELVPLIEYHRGRISKALEQDKDGISSAEQLRLFLEIMQSMVGFRSHMESLLEQTNVICRHLPALFFVKLTGVNIDDWESVKNTDFYKKLGEVSVTLKKDDVEGDVLKDLIKDVSQN